MSAGPYPKYQLPSGNWTTDQDRADRLWARQWTPGSAVWQIRHGEPGPRTDSASAYLAGMIEATGNTEELRALAADLMAGLEATQAAVRELRYRILEGEET